MIKEGLSKNVTDIGCQQATTTRVTTRGTRRQQVSTGLTFPSPSLQKAHFTKVVHRLHFFFFESSLHLHSYQGF